MNFLKFLLLSLICILVGGYFAANYYLADVSRKLLPQVKEIASDYGLEFDSLSIGSARISSISSLSWREIRGTFRVQNVAGIKSSQPFDFQIDSLTAGLIELSSGQFYLQTDGLELKTSASTGAKGHTEADTYVSDDNINSGSLVITRAQYPLSLGAIDRTVVKNRKKILKKLRVYFNRLQQAAKKGVIPKGLLLEGHVELSLRNGRHEVGILTEDVNGISRVRLHKKDLHHLSKQFYTRINSEEVELLAEYPLKTPRLLQLKYRAETDADAIYGSNEKSADEGVKDALQYVYWSYLLTKEYGSAFAKRVTDAHESIVPNQGPKERAMDLRNGSLGREFALKGVAYSALHKKVLTDPRVVRSY